MDHSSPRATFSVSGGSVFCLGTNGINSLAIKAIYPIQLENTTGVIKLRSSCSGLFSIACIAQNGQPDVIEVDWGDGTVTQETPYIGIHYPQYDAGWDAAWQHTYSSSTPKTITITPFTNTQIRTLHMHPNMHDYVDGHGVIAHNILSADLKEAAGIESFRLSEQPTLTEVNMSNCISTKSYHITNCPNLTTMQFASGMTCNSFELYMPNTGLVNPIINDVSKLSEIRIESCANLTTLNLSHDVNYKLTSIGAWGCPLLTSVIINDSIRLLNTVSITQTAVSGAVVDALLVQVLAQCNNPQPNQDDIDQFDAGIAFLQGEILTAENERDAYSAQIIVYNAELVILNDELVVLNDELDVLSDEGYGPGDQEYDDKEQEISDKEQEISDKEQEINDAQSEIDNINDYTIPDLESQIADIENQKQQAYDDVEPVTSGQFMFADTPAAIDGADTYTRSDLLTDLRDNFYWDVDDGGGGGGE